MSNIQLEMTIAAILLLILIIVCLKKSSITIKHSIAWLLLPFIFILIAIFPSPLTQLAHLLGFETLANFIFLISIASLIIICFFLTISISHQQKQITDLIQEVSILNHKNKKK